MPASGASEKVMFRLVVTDRSEPGRRWAGAGVAWFGQIAAGLTAPVGTVVAGVRHHRVHRPVEAV